MCPGLDIVLFYLHSKGVHNGYFTFVMLTFMTVEHFTDFVTV